MDCQDWTEVLVKKKIVFTPKISTHPKQSQSSLTLNKFDSNDEIIKAKNLSNESRQHIVQFRAVNKLMQKDLDARCSFPKNTIQLLESNKKAPSLKELQTLNRIMKTGLSL